jgi:hypothetical protein
MGDQWRTPLIEEKQWQLDVLSRQLIPIYQNSPEVDKLT